jgi:starch synthase
MEEMGLPVPEKGRHMLIGMVGRLAEQKGFDLVADAAARIAKKPVQIVMLGTGERKIQEMVEDMARKYPDRFAARIKYDRALSHRIYAGADAFLMPSRFEPCGLGQLVSLKYGTLPIVRSTGGLADTVHQVDIRKKQGNGFLFKPATVDGLMKAVNEAVDCFADETLWNKLSLDAMGEDYSWVTSAKRYDTLYSQCRDRKK